MASSESKDKVVAHLEANITNLLAEREDNTIKLKAEVVLLQQKLTDSESNVKKRILDMRKKVENEEQKRSQDMIDDLNSQIQKLKSGSEDQKQRI